MRNAVKTFALLLCAAFLGAVLSQAVVVVNKPDVQEPEPVVPEGFDPSVVEPTMGQR